VQRVAIVVVGVLATLAGLYIAGATGLGIQQSCEGGETGRPSGTFLCTSGFVWEVGVVVMALLVLLPVIGTILAALRDRWAPLAWTAGSAFALVAVFVAFL
jgi:hypothetical protein